MEKRINHAEEARRLIDATLAEEEARLEELKRIVEQNGTEVTCEQLVFGWWHDYIEGQ